MTDPLKIKTILCAVDLGADTGRIVAYALWLSRTINPSGENAPGIQLLHVMDYALTPPAYLMPYIEEEEAAVQKKLHGFVESIKSQGLEAGYRIAVGRLMECFNAAINETGAGMLVLGHKSHLIRPSSSERLIRSLEIPMLVLRGQKSKETGVDLPKVKKILCAVDFSETSLKALSFARALAGMSSAELLAVHVVSDREMEEGLQKWTSVSEDDRCKFRKNVVHEGFRGLSSFVPEHCKAELIVKAGMPYESINAAAMEKDADIIVAGARGLTHTGSAQFGSVSESIIKSSPCPVMIIR